jgi:hypothetical protein
MKCKSPIFAALWLGLTSAVVQAQARPASPPPMAHATGATSVSPQSGSTQPSPAAGGTAVANQNQGNALLAQSMASLAQYNSLAAKIRQRVELFDQQLVGTGSYCQGPVESHLLRWELKIRVGDQVTSLLQVCDGRSLWIHRQSSDKAMLEHVDMTRLRDAKRNAKVEGARQDGTATPDTVTPGTLAAPSLGSGGLSRLLMHLDRSFRFTSVQPVQLGRTPMRALRGEWEPGYLTRWLPKQRAAIEAGTPADTSKLMDHLPDHVVVFLGRDDLFPYRIEYRRKSPTLVGRALGKTDEFRTLLVMEFFDVQFNPPLEKSLFVFEPGDATKIDKTEEYLKDER